LRLAGGGGKGGLTFLPDGMAVIALAASSGLFAAGFAGLRQLEAADTLVATVETLRILLLLNLVKVVPEIELAELDDRQLLELGPRELCGDVPRSDCLSSPLRTDELRAVRSNWAAFEARGGNCEEASARHGEGPRPLRPRGAHGSALGWGGAALRPMISWLTFLAVEDGVGTYGP